MPPSAHLLAEALRHAVYQLLLLGRMRFADAVSLQQVGRAE